MSSDIEERWLKRKIKRVKYFPLLKKIKVKYSVKYTEHPYNAVDIVKKNIESGKNFISAIGDDGTVNEVL